jgi:phosphopantothenoylcysteine decarboxylase / phosphopantothenate---cysteine ligase
MLKGKKIILGITGGIAAYKAAFLLRLFKKAGAEVRVVVTSNALEFITRVTLESLSENKVYDKVFGEENDYTTEHVALTDWGDAFVVAPATANIIGKLANGIADDALSTSLLAFNKKVFFAPAMNCKMWDHFALQNNLKFLINNGIHIIEPAEGFLACGYEGRGRMEEPGKIYEAVQDFFKENTSSLVGKKILLTAGPTHEAIDPVRYIGNRSSGKMGYALAEEFATRGAEVQLISGPVRLLPKHQNIVLTNVTTASEMLEACENHFDNCDAAIMAAAVADYKPEVAGTKKMKKENSSEKFQIPLVHTPDILANLGKKKKHRILAGFALETDCEQENAIRKLKSKNLDFIVLNSLKDEGAGFEHNTNKITIINNKMEVSRYHLKDKKEVAVDIADTLEKYFSR